MTTEALQIVSDTPSRDLPAIEATPMAMIATAVARGADIAQLEKLMALQERWQANEARMAFTKAMAAFKANPPEILKDKAVKFNQTAYRHATLGNVCSAIVAGLADHQISHSWRTTQNDKTVTVECVLTHSQGHSESVSLSGPLDSSGSKNSIQQVGSTITYLQRYTLLSATGLATLETDDDGRAAGAPKNVGEVSDPQRQPDPESQEQIAWQELYPDLWRDNFPKSGSEKLGALAALPEGDKLISKLWAADRANPALCAWGARYILRTAKALDIDWRELPGMPDALEDLTPAGLWAIALDLRKRKAAAA